MGAIFPSTWPNSVSAAELVRNFAECREVAAQRSLPVTHHGRTTHVLMGIEAFNELKQATEADRESSVPDASLVYNLADWLDAGLILCDERRTMQFVNRMALGITRAPPHGLVGRPLLEGLPQLAGSLIETHLRRTETAGEFGSADTPSPFSEGCWLRFQSFPLGPWNALLFHDITEEVQRHWLADVKQALFDAMHLHGGVCFAQLSVRGTIDSVNGPCSQLVGLSPDRLRGVAFADMVTTPERVAFRDALEAVLRGDGDRQLETQLLTNGGAIVTIQLSLTQLRGTYGVEGAIALATAIA
jgi:PAS domain S-box-containing protein